MTALSTDAQFLDMNADGADYDNSLVPFPDGDLYGYMDRSGKVVIQPDYEAAQFFDNRGFARVKQFGLEGLIDKSGKMVVPAIESSLSEDRMRPCQNTEESLTGEWLIGIYRVDNYKSKDYLFYKYDNTTNSYITSKRYKKHKSPQEDQISYNAKNLDYDKFYLGYVRVVRESGKVNFIDTTFAEVLAQDIYDGEQLGSGLFSEYNTEGKCRLIDAKGKSFTDFDYHSLEYSGLSNYFISELKEESGYSRTKGLTGKDGKVLLDPIYRDIKFLNDEFFAVDSSSSKAIYSINDGFTTGFDYKNIQEHHSNTFLITNEEGSSIVTEVGKQIAGPFTLDKPGFGRGYAIIKDSEQRTLIDEHGNALFGLSEKSFVKTFRSDFVIIQDQNVQMLFDRKGNPILDGKLKMVEFLNMGNRLFVADQFNHGIYNMDTKSWDVTPGDYQIVYRVVNGSWVRNEVILSNHKEQITIQDNWENRSTKTFPPTEKKNTVNLSTKYNNEEQTATVSLPDGSEITYPKSRKIDVSVHNKTVYLVERLENRQKILVDRNLNQISPQGYSLDGYINLGERRYYSIENTERDEGVIDLEGNIKIQPQSKQQVSLGAGYCIVRNAAGITIYDENFKQVSNGNYNSYSSKEDYVICSNSEDATIDIYHKTNQKISEKTYTDVLRTSEDYIVVRDKRDPMLSCTILDNAGKITNTFPYAEVYPIEADSDYYIAKDLHDYGIISEQGKVLIPFKYQDIVWHEDIKLFAIRKAEYHHMLLDEKLNVKYEDLNSYVKFNAVGDKFYTRGDTEYSLFDQQGNFLFELPNSVGSPSFTDKYMELGFIICTKDGKQFFIDAENGKPFLR